MQKLGISPLTLIRNKINSSWMKTHIIHHNNSTHNTDSTHKQQIWQKHHHAICENLASFTSKDRLKF